MPNIVILDRDGVINHDSEEYIKSPEEWRPIKGSLEAIAHLCRAGYVIVVATNQSGIARNLYTVTTLDAIHKKMTDAVNSHGGHLTRIFYCPHHPDANCNCRKPRVGLLAQIAAFLDSDLQGTPFIGDSLRDIQAAEAFGCRPILVKTGYGLRTLGSLTEPYPETFTDLLAAALAIIDRGH
ncbi:MAG: D-glycero-beta-D-manno-heptose 1,7-bisphosphate 7-phosphatase [Gammaproteobacteria bacterium]|nr:D-glycero-beta-D-manno-heptose 1,7-bisphosphate 7-phosphatase [Gammaproteobacteria bacterium]